MSNEIAKEVLRNAIWQANKTIPFYEMKVEILMTLNQIEDELENENITNEKIYNEPSGMDLTDKVWEREKLLEEWAEETQAILTRSLEPLFRHLIKKLEEKGVIK